MKKITQTPKIIILCLAIFIIAGVIATTSSQTQNSNQISQVSPTPPLTAEQLKNLQQLQKLQQDVPVAIYDEPLPSNLAEKTKREKKNKARNLKAQYGEDPKRFALTEQSQSTYGGVPTHFRDQPAIPAKQSDAVIIGEVTKAKAYLSEDKTSIYSEFDVSRPEVLKNTTSESITTKTPIAITRGGGGVKLPSGKIIFNFSLATRMPKVGKKYLFFLKYSVETGFSIITAYELTQGQVSPLDGVTPEGNVIRQYAGQQSFKGMSEADFITQVKEAIEKNSDVMKRGE